ncbi:zinc ribbon domain-containing protein [Nocardiopsis tropica]|uniref:FmdB family transcriptional regulator n=1 Tax=Streptomonospora nanhaiensis TaxID=1323731 RepID=A0ABY6YPC3_9ACTN|nr:FmdB family zinc ribbon protein [Streptomonospora nanhaiensis]MEE2045576.1 zinc ribbon domain-containing protein [Nocardiopsis tropica]WAE74247.1 FmdB family transcriptional regulator [Streptomonospora nanhaiensis]
MPTYQYACTECDAQMEVVQSFSDDALTVCPECEGRLRKVYSAVGIVFKGSGFYRTDSGKTSNSSVLTGSNAGSGDGKDSGSSESGGTASSGTDAKSSSGDSGSKAGTGAGTSTSTSTTSSTAAAAG